MSNRGRGVGQEMSMLEWVHKDSRSAMLLIESFLVSNQSTLLHCFLITNVNIVAVSSGTSDCVAAKLQAWWRMLQAVTHVAKLKQALAADEVPAAAAAAAASLKMQTWWRMLQAVTHVAKLRVAAAVPNPLEELKTSTLAVLSSGVMDGEVLVSGYCDAANCYLKHVGLRSRFKQAKKNVYLQLRVKNTRYGFGDCYHGPDGKVIAIMGFTIESVDRASSTKSVAVHCYTFQKSTKIYVDDVLEVIQLAELAAQTKRFAYDEIPFFNGTTGKKVSFTSKVKSYSYCARSPGKRASKKITIYDGTVEPSILQKRAAESELPPPTPPPPPNPVDEKPLQAKSNARKTTTSATAGTKKAKIVESKPRRASRSRKKEDESDTLTLNNLKSVVSAALSAAVVPAAAVVSAAVVPAAVAPAPAVEVVPARPTREDDLKYQKELANMFFSIKEQDQVLKLREHQAYHQSKMEEWGILGMSSASSSSRSQNPIEKPSAPSVIIQDAAAAIKEIKMEKPSSTLNLASGLTYCRRWLQDNGGGAEVDDICRPGDLVAYCVEFLDCPSGLQAQIEFADNSIRDKLNYVVDFLQAGDEED